MNEQKNEHLAISLITLAYGISLVFAESTFVLFQNNYKSHFSIVMILIGVLSLILNRNKRWKLLGSMLVIKTVLWSFVVAQYFILPSRNSAWVITSYIVIHSISILRKGDWREH